MSACCGQVPKRRTLLHEPTYEEQLAAIVPCACRADEFLDGATQALARDPSSCGKPTAPRSLVWRMVTNDVANVSPLVIYYAFNDDLVYLLAIEVINEEDPWADE